jgi:hypothetical protein
MTPSQFIARWRDNPLSERAGSQAFFLDLCALLGVAAPNDPDDYCFERGATRTGAGHGWADVWKRGHFGWENKGPGGDLGSALKQLMTYALALDNPPLLVVSNRDVTEIHTHFTGRPSETHTIRLEDIGTPENLQKLRWLFADPEKFRPGRTVQEITADAAGRFADIAQSMTSRGHDPQKVAHFLIQCLFCMFAEDIELLPKQLFERVLNKRGADTVKLSAALGELFRAMQTGGDFLLEDIAWFNGGLFARVDLIELTPGEVAALHAASKMDWSAIEPAILGTLFERGLDPKIRAPLGANYTDPGTIMKLVNPVIVEPLAREWAQARARIGPLVARYHAGGKGSQMAWKEAQALFLGYIERLKDFRVLDPACGSGNFLYLSLRALKDLEHRANLDAEALGLQRQLAIETSPANVLGIEINAYAAELARVTVWVGEIQWMLKNGYDFRRNPILAPARPHRAPRRAAQRRRQRSGVAEGRCDRRQSAVSRRQDDARRTRRRLRRTSAQALRRPRSWRRRPGDLLVRKEPRADRSRLVRACRACCNQLHSRRCQPKGAGSHHQNDADLRSLERRGVGE